MSAELGRIVAQALAAFAEAVARGDFGKAERLAAVFFTVEREALFTAFHKDA
ncbi:hypothetical protein BH20ACT24_BH20ACT24_16150 [soil metagenome]